MSSLKEFAKLLKEAQEQKKEEKALDNFSKLLKETKLSAAPKIEPEPVLETVLEETTLSDTEIVLEEEIAIDPIEQVASALTKKTDNIEAQRWNDPLRKAPNEKFVTFKEMNDHYSNFLNRIQQQMSSIGGGGEVKFAKLDDVTSSSVGLNKYLTYDQNTRKFYFNTIQTGEGIRLDGSNRVALSVATETTLGGFKLGPGVTLNPFDQLIIDPTGLDFSFGDFFAYVANGASGGPAAYLSSLNENEDIVIQSNGTGQVDIVGRFGIFPVDGPLDTRDPVFSVNDAGDVSATTLNIVNKNDLGLRAPLNVTINEQGRTRTPAIVTGSVAQFTGRDNRAPLIVLDSYGVDVTRSITGGEFTFRTGRGTNETPSPILAGDIIGNVTAAGWASGNGYGGIGVGGIRIIADENFTSTTRGSRVEIYTTPKGTITPTRIVTIDDAGLSFNENDTTGISNVDYITFDPTHVDTANTEGVLAWNKDDTTLNIHHPDGVVQQVGQELYVKVRNRTGSKILNGTVVRFSGAEQDDGTSRLLVEPFLANGTYPNIYGLGITTQDIQNGSDGFVTVWGKIRDLNTSAWNVGDILYASSSVAGNLVNVKPTAPNNVVPFAIVVKKDSTLGEIFVRPIVEQRQFYGAFSDSQSHTANTANTAYAVPLNTTEFSNGVSIDLADNTKVITQQSGLYDFKFSTQFVSSNSASKEIYIWARKDGQDIPNSASRLTISGNGSYIVPSWNFMVSMNAGSFFQLMWAVSDTSVSIAAPAATSFAPATPSTILTVTQVAL
jgi:hypothetical protein